MKQTRNRPCVDPQIRFWKKVNKDGPIPQHCPCLGACWLWTGAKRSHGHGRFSVPGIGASAHRYSYHIHYGPIPDGQNVLHKCDNGACQNPAHLFLGTQSDNMKDAQKKGRTTQGEKDAQARLTSEFVLEVRRRHANGETQKSIVLSTGESFSTVGKIVRRERWKHI